MRDDVATAYGLGALDQVAFVVRDLDAALADYEPLFGRFKVFTVNPHSVYRDRPVRPVLRIGVARPGPIEIELIQVLEGDAPHRDHLERHGEGLHHVRFRVEDLDTTRAAMERDGFSTIWSGGQDNVRFAYLEMPGSGESVVELLEVT
jgi:hypothetical protein